MDIKKHIFRAYDIRGIYPIDLNEEAFSLIGQAHASAIETYIEHFVGLKETGYGDVYFQRTLEDWAKFNINNRTKHDASISSGLALMACNKHRYSPVNKKIIKPVDLGIKRYDNRGTTSKIIS